MSLSELKKSVLQITSCLLILAILGLSLDFISPSKSEAQVAVPVIEVAGSPLLISTLTIQQQNLWVAQNTSQLVYKELGPVGLPPVPPVSVAGSFLSLDNITYSAAKIIISNITNSIVAWINSGFQGSPAFIENPSDFLTDVADQVAGNFIAGTELGFLCSPFSLNIRFALNFTYSSNFENKVYCRLTDVVSNVENFANFTAGDFSQGGWKSWFQITQTPSNNALGAYLSAQHEMNLRVSESQFIQDKLLTWGRGFLSFSDEDGNITTPGAVIEGQLENVLGSGVRQLELADEINEVVAALIGYLVQNVLLNGLSNA